MISETWKEKSMIGFDIGGTKCAVSYGIECAEGFPILDKRTIPTEHGGTL